MKTNLKEIRKSRGWRSAKAFAEHIGMQEKTYRNYEQGTRSLYLDVACKLCDALDCSLDELAGRSKGEYLTRDERDLLNISRSLSPKGKEKLKEYASDVAALHPKSDTAEMSA